MKESAFLNKLKKGEKLELIDPSEEIAKSYELKSQSHFESSKILLKSEKLEESVSMAYYGMYHCLLALFFRCGIKCENHTASIILLEQLFKQKELAGIIRFGKKERIDKQYYTDFKLTKEDCKDMTKKTEDFIVGCKRIIKELNKEKISGIRKKFENI